MAEDTARVPDESSPPERAAAAAAEHPPEAGKPAAGKPASGGQQSSGPLDWMRLSLGSDLVALGFILIVAVFALAAAFLPAELVINAVSPVIAMVGTLVGAVYGVQAGAKGKDEANARAVEAAALVDPERGQTLIESWRNSSASGNPREEDIG